MFHKASLQEVDDASVAAEVRDAIAAAQRRVVGVVVNAVDDSLAKGEQIDTRWTHDEIKILPTLLHEAKAAHRIVILLADHGHVVDHQTQGRRGEGGERWRIDDAQPAADELQVSGSRVLIPANHRLIAPWTEKVRYGVKKNGYHGGVSPQEMVIPITVLCASDAVPAGWVEAAMTTPAWWDEPFLAPQPAVAVPLRRTASHTRGTRAVIRLCPGSSGSRPACRQCSTLRRACACVATGVLRLADSRCAETARGTHRAG